MSDQSRETPAAGPELPAAGAVPVACTLTPAGLAGRLRRWRRLAAGSMTGRAETAEGLRLSFRPGPGTERELRELAAAESTCCPWATWTVRPGGGQLLLEIRASGEGIAALHGMFAGQPRRPGRGQPPT